MNAIVVPLWKRFNVSSVHMRCLFEAIKRAGLESNTRIFWIISPREDPLNWPMLVEAFDTAGISWIINHENQPLADKVNAGFIAAMAQGADQIMYLNSDNLLTANYLQAAFNGFENDAYSMADAVWFACSERRLAFRATVKTMGAFAVFRRKVLEATEGCVMWSGRTRGIDAKPLRWMERFGITDETPRIEIAEFPHDGRIIVDWKSANNMGTYDRMWGAFGDDHFHMDDPIFASNYEDLANYFEREANIDIRTRLLSRG